MCKQPPSAQTIRSRLPVVSSFWRLSLPFFSRLQHIDTHLTPTDRPEFRLITSCRAYYSSVYLGVGCVSSPAPRPLPIACAGAKNHRRGSPESVKSQRRFWASQSWNSRLAELWPAYPSRHDTNAFNQTTKEVGRFQKPAKSATE